MYSACESLNLQRQVTCVLLRRLGSVPSLFPSLWILAGFSVEVQTPIIKLHLLFLITFQRPLTSILCVPRKAQTVVFKPLVLVCCIFMQIRLHVQWMNLIAQ